MRKRPASTRIAARSARKGNCLLVVPEHFRPGLEIVRRLRAAGWETYLVGGIVRDLLIGRPPKDVDIVTAAPPEATAALFERTVPVGAEFGVVAVVLDGHPYQVATFRREGPYLDGRRPSFVEFSDARSDVMRRDFTVNALLYDPVADAVIDHVGGRADLERRVIRTVGDPTERFLEDRLRMLRAIRFAAELEFAIDPPTLDAITALAPQVAGVSAERIRDELVRLLVAPGRAAGVRLLESTGLLRVVLPEVPAMRGVPQPPEFHPEGDVLTHTVLALEYLEEPSPVLAMAVLLHDVGKPPTFSVSDRIRFHNHPAVGAAMAEAICQRLRFSAADTRAIVTLVADHLRIGDLPAMRPGRAARFLRRAEIDDLLELHRVDCLASHRNLATYEWVVQARRGMSAEPPPRLLTGDDLIALGYPPSPRFAEMLEAAEVAQAEEEFTTREEARAWIRARFPEGEVSATAEPHEQRGTGRAGE
ncbi:MAG: CCA tRNA nucleotidyltransferase [Armatimonadota bacterium]